MHMCIDGHICPYLLISALRAILKIVFYCIFGKKWFETLRHCFFYFTRITGLHIDTNS